jgi:hypothetical protein
LLLFFIIYLLNYDIKYNYKLVYGYNKSCKLNKGNNKDIIYKVKSLKELKDKLNLKEGR